MDTRREFLFKGSLGIAAALVAGSARSNPPLRIQGTGKLKDVNTTDIRDAIMLGCQTMSNVFNADDNDIPFFGTYVSEEKESRFFFSSSHSESHVPGRHLNALLRAEDVLKLKVEESVIDKHAQAAFYSYSGAIPAPLNRDKIGGQLVRFIPHNIREGFHALYALARYRNSAEAKKMAEKSIDFIFKYWSPRDGWNKPPLERMGLTVFEGIGHYIAGIARAIGPLVKYHKATGSPKALELALLLKDKAVAEAFLEDGSFDLSRMGFHTHSVTCVMSSLAQLADLTSDAQLLHRVKVFFDRGLKDISDPIGWSIENANPDSNPDRGESNNSGDILETALILGKWGHTTYFHQAERILRAHLLPSQLRDISFIHESPSPTEDAKRDVARRHRGAWGFPAPYGHKALGLEGMSFNMDIVGGTVASLCEAYANIHTLSEAGHRVNLLFDYESDLIKIQSPYTHGKLELQLKKQAPLFVRIPEWAEVSSIQSTGAQAHPVLQNGYLIFPSPPVGKPITVGFPLPEHQTVLPHRTRQIRVKWKGDSVIAMDNFGSGLTYFDPF